jgi:hypothetical protein
VFLWGLCAFFPFEYQVEQIEEDWCGQKENGYEYGFASSYPVDEFVEFVEPKGPGNDADPHGRDDDEKGIPVVVTFEVGDEGPDGGPGPGERDPHKKGDAQSAPSFEGLLPLFCFCSHGFDGFGHEFESFDACRKEHEQGIHQKNVRRVVEHDDANDQGGREAVFQTDRDKGQSSPHVVGGEHGKEFGGRGLVEDRTQNEKHQFDPQHHDTDTEWPKFKHGQSQIVYSIWARHFQLKSSAVRTLLSVSD